MTRRGCNWPPPYAAGCRDSEAQQLAGVRKLFRDTNNGDERIGDAMESKWQRAGMVGAALAASQPVLAEYAYNLQEPASKVAHEGLDPGADSVRVLAGLMTSCSPDLWRRPS